jgi:hypothetical protein
MWECVLFTCPENVGECSFHFSEKMWGVGFSRFQKMWESGFIPTTPIGSRSRDHHAKHRRLADQQFAIATTVLTTGKTIERYSTGDCW